MAVGWLWVSTFINTWMGSWCAAYTSVRAAIAAASSYRANPTRSDGSPAANSTTRIGVQFRAPE
jgi:hypothetical protein